MSRIGATIHGFEQYLLTQLARSNQAVAASSFRLATGNYYNFPSDGPSAFLQVSMYENQLNLLSSVRSNVDVAANIGATAQTTLSSIRTQLNTIRTALLEDEDNTLTAAEKSTNQSTIDTAIDTIRSLARTSVDGKRFLDGSFDYTYSGKDPSQIKSLEVFDLEDDTVVSGSVSSAATQTTRRYTGAAGLTTASATFTLTGKRGWTTIAVADLEALTAVRDRINLDSHDTGIVASVSGDNLDFTTVDYGDAATIDISVTSGTFANASVATGADAVVSMNGNTISNANIDGNRVSYFDNGVNVAVEFQAGFSGAFSAVTISDDHVANFSLSTRVGERIKLAVPAVFPELLGGISGYLSRIESGGSLAGLGTNTSAAIRIVDEALAQHSTIEGRVDAFADVAVESASNLLSDLQTNVEDSIENLNTVDDDQQQLVRARYAYLSDNAVAAIAILQQQQSNMVGLLQLLAGLN